MIGSQAFFVSAGCIFAGALLGLLLSHLLPEEHLRDKSKDTVKVVTGMIATLAALVLGLLISSANTSFDAVDTAITQSAAKVILLDRALANYGPETKEAREHLRSAVIARIEMFWSGENTEGSGLKGFEWTPGMETLQTKIPALAPTTNSERVTSEADKLGSDSWNPMALDAKRNTIPKTFLSSCSLAHNLKSAWPAAPRNATAITMLRSVPYRFRVDDPLSGRCISLSTAWSKFPAALRKRWNTWAGRETSTKRKRRN